MLSLSIVMTVTVTYQEYFYLPHPEQGHFSSPMYCPQGAPLLIKLGNIPLYHFLGWLYKTLARENEL